MTRRKLRAPLAILAMPACLVAHGGAGAAAPTPAMVISYWCYMAFLPILLVAFVVYGWLIQPKG